MGVVEDEAVGVASDVGRRLGRAEQEAREVAERLRETSRALLEANQALARIPLLEFRMEEIWQERVRLAEENEGLLRERAELGEEIRRLEQDGSRAWARVHALESSKSWRLLAPLRRVRAFFQRG